MNENDRRFFLKRFFSFNSNSTASNTAASIYNGSFEEDQETVPPSQQQQQQQQSARTKSASGAILPAILVEHVDDKTINNNTQTQVMANSCNNHSETTASTPGPISIDDLNECCEVSTPSSTAPLILTRMDAFDCQETAKALLQQQNSIELKPFRKKEVLILDSDGTPKRTTTMTTNEAGEPLLPLFIERLPKYKARIMAGDEPILVVKHDVASASNLPTPISIAQPFYLNLKYRLVISRKSLDSPIQKFLLLYPQKLIR